jgi:hypothetical protein
VPNAARPIAAAVTLASTTRPNDSAWKSPRISSSAKNTPAIGALKVAEIPPAAPQATSSRSRDSGTRTSCPRVLPSAEPICTIGPSRPTEPPAPIHSADTQRRGQRLDQGDLGADPPAALGDRRHHLGDAVAAGLAGKPVDQRPVQQPAGHRRQQHEPAAQPRHQRVWSVSGSGGAVVGMAAEQHGEATDEVAEADRPKPRAHPHRQRQRHQPRRATPQPPVAS